jgi:oligopeptide transport system substrate-binding protein
MFRNKTLVLLIILALFAGFGATAQEEGYKVLNWNWSTEPPSLDPSIATDTTSHQIIAEIFPSLTRVHEETGELQPGMATWEVDESGTVYTFTVMEGVPWVKYNEETGEVEEVADEEGNVRYITAGDFAYGAMRTLNPETAGDYAYVLAWAVEGGDAYNQANPEEDDLEALRAEVGIEVIDEYTLQITTPYKAAFMANILGMWMAAAQPEWVIEGTGDFWTEPENIVSYGPYAVKNWYHDDSLTLIKNPLWAGTEAIPAPMIDEIYGVMITEDSTGFSMYEAGTLDVQAPPLSEMDRIKADPVLSEELYIGPRFCTYYYGFNVEKAPVDNVHLRRALSAAIDRQSLIDNVLKGGQEPARWFSRPGLVAAPTMDTHPDIGIGYDPAMAEEELAAALADMGLADVSELPVITLMHNESEGHARIAQAIQQMWKDQLGIEVEISTQEWGVYLETVSEDAPQIFRMGWCEDYPDAHNFASDVFHSTSAHNDTNWANPDYDALIEEAMVLDDQEERRDLYAQAENILNYEDAAISSIYWYTSVQMTKPYVDRTYALYGSQYFEKWDIVQE